MFQSLTGIEYLKVEIAAKHDKTMEKATWDERLAHFEKLELNDAFGNPSTFTKASNPIGLRAAVEAWSKAIQNQPTGYMISLDACSSGLQILSLLVSCPKSFNLCGGISDKCVDSYTTIYDGMNLHGALTRKAVKQAIMTAFYGSTAMPEIVFGSNIDIFYDTISDMAPGAWDLNMSLQDLWDIIPDATYNWVLPDNFHAGIETKDSETLDFTFLDGKFSVKRKVIGRPKFHKGLGPNLIHSVDGMVVREMYRRCMFNAEKLTRLIEVISGQIAYEHEQDNSELVKVLWSHYKKTGFLSARILELLDSNTITLVDELVVAKMIATLPNAPFELVSVHDCFRCHPNYGNDLRRQYNNIMADINDSTILKSMAEAVSQRSLNTKKYGKIKRETILESNYMLA